MFAYVRSETEGDAKISRTLCFPSGLEKVRVFAFDVTTVLPAALVMSTERAEHEAHNHRYLFRGKERCVVAF
jgi:hypothetical protein